MMIRLISSERLKWMFLTGVVAIGTGFTAKNVISYPTECIREEVVKILCHTQRNFKRFHHFLVFFLNKSKKPLHLNKEILKCFSLILFGR